MWDCSHYHALFREKVPSYTAIPFMATAPIINPVVLFATYMAFGNSWYYVILRFSELSDCHDLGILLGFVVDDQILKDKRKSNHVHDYSGLSAGKKSFSPWFMLSMNFRSLALPDFGACGCRMQTYLLPNPNDIGHNSVTAILIMMLWPLFLSLCSAGRCLYRGFLISLVLEWHQQWPSLSSVLWLISRT